MLLAYVPSDYPAEGTWGLIFGAAFLLALVLWVWTCHRSIKHDNPDIPDWHYIDGPPM